jgi:two-component system sensor histidine kinase GlrK
LPRIITAVVVYYPRSFLKFILLGFLLVSLPLVYALGELILSLDQLQTQGREAVQQAAEAGRASRQLFEQSVTLERIVRQHLILDDNALLEDYGRVRQEFRATARQLALLPLEPDSLAALDALTDSESRLHKLLTMPLRTAESQVQLADGYARLSDRTQAMLAASNQLTERAIERLQEIATQGRQKWLYLALATAAIALALAILFAVLIARPIRQLDQAIRRMGTADFTHAIEVNGPQDLRYLGQRLEWLRSRLSELEEQQNRFLRHVSHELKTPLTAVREGAELLRDNVGGKLSAEQREIVRIVRENSISLQKLIEDLLTYHQTRAMEPQTVGPVLMPDVVRRVLKEHKLAALARMVTFESELEPAMIVGDADRVRTIVDNLISNAIKYSPRSTPVVVKLSVERDFAVLDVIDQGPGIGADERQHIFDSFYQGKPPVDGRVKGSGLGLAIAREYALAHGGRIEVQDRADRKRGAHFRLSLPLATGESGTDARADAAPARITMAGGA